MDIMNRQCWCVHLAVAVAVDALLKDAFRCCLRSSSASVNRRHSSLTLGSGIVLAIRVLMSRGAWPEDGLGALSVRPAVSMQVDWQGWHVKGIGALQAARWRAR